jgi:hypothetical protein
MDMKIRTATAAAFVVLAATIATAAPVEERLTQGKLAADLGDHAAAEKAFASVSADHAASPPSRAEALVRLGIIQRTQGKTQASVDAFQKAMQSPGRDAAVTRLLALAVAGVAPERARWEKDWSKVSLAARGGAPVIVWPGAAPKGVRELFPSDPVTFDLQDVSLTAFLAHFLGHWKGPQAGERVRKNVIGFENWPLSYKVPVALQEGTMDYVIHADVQGYRPDGFDARAAHLSVKATNMPWNELFESVLASHGLGFVLEKNLLLIAPLDKLGALDRARGRSYPGQTSSLVLCNAHAYPAMTPRGKTLEEFRRSAQDPTAQVHDPGAFSDGAFQDIWGFRFVVDPDLQGTFNYRLMHRPSMEILDLMLASTDAVAVRLPDENGKPVLRIATVAAAGAQALDLSKVQPAVAAK